jgi:regulator of sigma E protease
MISAIPLGGYVRMLGDDPTEDLGPDEAPVSFLTQGTFKKIFIVAAGPVANFIFAAFALWIVFMLGVPVLESVVGDVLPDSPAERAGLVAEDRIVSIDGVPISEWEEMSRLIQESGGEELALIVERTADGAPEELTIHITPELREGINELMLPDQVYMIGISMSDSYHYDRRGPIGAIGASVVETGRIVGITFIVIGKMFSGDVPLNNLGGPILIAQVSAEAFRLGLMEFLYFLALISINLGILNLLPVPVLDGGHLMFFVIEGVIGRPINLRIKEIALQIGLVLLVALMALAFYFDISRLFTGE